MSEEALTTLETAIGKGWGNRDWLEHDTDLDSLRGTPRFEAIVAAMKRSPVAAEGRSEVSVR
jgi:hypothetical protein